MMIPGLPDDIALQCLIRLPNFSLLRMRCVSKAWNELLSSKELYLLRRRHSPVDDWLFLVVSGISCLNRSTRLLAYDIKSAASHRIQGTSEAEKHLDLMGVCCASRDQRLFILGGSSATHDGTELENHSKLTIFDAATSSWTAGSSMELARSYFASGFLDGTLYVAGGCDMEQSTEAYDSEVDKWTRVKSMPFGFNHIESSAVFKSKLYVKGVSGSRRRVLVLDPSGGGGGGGGSKQWFTSPSLEANLRDGEFVATDENLYVINKGGYVGVLDGEQGWKEVGVVSHCFLPFAASSPSSLQDRAVFFFRNDAFFVIGKTGENIDDLKRSTQLQKALLVTFYHCQAAVIRL